MKRLLCVLLLGALTLAAADLTGKWSGSFETTGPNGEARTAGALMNLKHTGNTITGTAGPDESRQFQIANGKVDGERITFEATNNAGMTLRFDLSLVDGRLRGQARAESDGSVLTAKLDLERQ